MNKESLLKDEYKKVKYIIIYAYHINGNRTGEMIKIPEYYKIILDETSEYYKIVIMDDDREVYDIQYPKTEIYKVEIRSE